MTRSLKHRVGSAAEQGLGQGSARQKLVRTRTRSLKWIGPRRSRGRGRPWTPERPREWAPLDSGGAAGGGPRAAALPAGAALPRADPRPVTPRFREGTGRGSLGVGNARAFIPPPNSTNGAFCRPRRSSPLVLGSENTASRSPPRSGYVLTKCHRKRAAAAQELGDQRAQ